MRPWPLLLLLTACAAPGGQVSTLGCSGQLTVRNSSSQAIEQIYVSQAGPRDWGPDLLATGTMPMGDSRTFQAKPGVNSFRAVFVNGRAAEMAGLDVCDTPVLTVLPNNLAPGR